MKRSETIDKLRQKALAIGTQPPSARLVRKWVDEGLLSPARKQSRGHGKGAESIDPPENLEIGEKIVELRSRGIARTSELRVHLFLENKNSDVDGFRTALISEHDRAIKNLYRGKTYPKDYKNSDPQKSLTASVEANRLGPIAEIFVQAGLKLPDAKLLSVASGAAHEYFPDKKDQNIILKFLSQIFGVSPELENFPSFAGLLILRDGNDAIPPIDLIQDASDADLIDARNTFNSLKLAFSNFGQLSNLIGLNCTEKMKKAFYHGALALESTTFAVTIFPLCIEGAKWLREQHPEFPSSPEQILEMMQAMNGQSVVAIGATKPKN